MHAMTQQHVELDERGRADRRSILRVVQESGRGHVGAAFSAMEIVRVLYDDILRVDPQNPDWPDRDRFIFSKGHGCIALYIMLAEKGFIPEAELSRACQFEAMLGGHPEAEKIPGVETSTGSLGHGLSVGVGCAIAARIDRQDWRTYVLVGDGESNEGSVWEAALSAGKHGLSSLTVLVDYNQFQSYGPAAYIQPLEPFAEKWRAFGFDAHEVDGHDRTALRDLLRRLPASRERPQAVICHTVKGKGLAEIENNADWHHKSRIDPAELAPLYAELAGGES